MHDVALCHKWDEAVRVISAVVAWIKSISALADKRICWPRWPALILICSWNRQELSILVENCFFIPIGEHPPLTYPVRAGRSFTWIISRFLFLLIRAAAFKSSSFEDGKQKIIGPVLSPFVTMVLKTMAGSYPRAVAAWVPDRYFLCIHKILRCMVFLPYQVYA